MGVSRKAITTGLPVSRTVSISFWWPGWNGWNLHIKRDLGFIFSFDMDKTGFTNKVYFFSKFFIGTYGRNNHVISLLIQFIR